MDSTARNAVVDLIIASDTLNSFVKEAIATLKTGAPYPLEDEVRDELRQSMALMSATLAEL
ncbi:hypothetical protein RHM65_22240 [Pseudomonas sp. CCI4.2]|uniref:hypothetical protein n=1 Tax=Pseudomonas sp. CCI4.2 TaxID=3048620 RepID=UPI002AC9CB82|nr:hypothetical protein [Pseudomonas sp. CCI4.2]MEB0090074.1 hypothetical protein [Pseudomonas sp. CCI4.2]WPX53462.1 hypothetical protein RHM65_22240 [Pseudomonas sp. CCI4.2]